LYVAGYAAVERERQSPRPAIESVATRSVRRPSRREGAASGARHP
jgi:hypothetical protein